MSASPSPFAHCSKKRNGPRPAEATFLSGEVVRTGGSLPYAGERFLAIHANVVPAISRPTITTKGQVAFPVNAVSHGGVAHWSGPGFDPDAASTDVFTVVGGGLVEVEVEGGGVDEVDGGGVEVVDGGGVDDVVVGGGLVGGGVEDGGTITHAAMSSDGFTGEPSNVAITTESPSIGPTDSAYHETIFPCAL
jgi:hypothetical protein